MDIINSHSQEFIECNTMFTAQMRELKRIGKADTVHHEPLTEEDMTKTYQYFERGIEDTAECLQQKVFFDLCLHLLRRGRENLRDLTVHHFQVSTDSSDYRYVHQCIDEQTKNHQSDGTKRQGRMYEVKNHSLCPVRSFERYVSLLSPSSNAFFQYPKSDVRDNTHCWFHPRPVGHNMLGNMVAKISISAGLSLRYTNHCLRATSVTVLDSAQFPGRHIMAVSGHKSESSLKHYNHHTSEKQKRDMSTALNKSLGLDTVLSQEPASSVKDKQSVSPTSPLDATNVTPALQDISNVTDVMELSDEVLAAIPLPQSPPMMSSFTSTSTCNNQWNMVPIAPNISNSNVTINYNFFGNN